MVALFAAALAPFARLVWGVAQDALGANPVEVVTRATGWWTLFFLCATLAVTPLRRATGWNALARRRRMLGLFAFFYAFLHFATYIWLDAFFDPATIVKDVFKRPFITAGFTAFLLLVPLAATSTAAMQKRLGRRWLLLHRLVYLAATLGVVHYWWLVKADITEPVRFALVLGVLFMARLVWRLRTGTRAATDRARA